MAFLLLLLNSQLATVTFCRQNSWMNTGGPFKGSTISIATGSDGLIFVATHTGIYRSTDHGQSWTLLADSPWPEHLSTSFPASLFPSPNSIIVAASRSVFMMTGDSLVFRSTDNGNSWTSLELALNNVSVRSIIASSAGDLFALVDSVGILHSSDNGEHWTQMNLHLPISHVYSLAVDSTRLMMISTDTCYYISTDNGSNWLPSVGGDGNLLAIAPNGTIFTAVANPGFVQVGPNSNVGMVFRSTDDGGHWSACYSVTTSSHQMVNLPPLNALAVSSAGNVVFTTSDAICRSTDNGLTWSTIPWNNWQLLDNSRAIGTDFDGNLFIGANQCGILRLANGDTTFTLVPGGFSSVMVSAIATNSSGHVFAAVDSGVYRSIDNGQHWSQILAPLFPNPTFKVITAKINSQGTIYALKSVQANSGYLFRSIDNGDHWDSLGNRGSSLGISQNGILYQGWSGGLSPIYRSTDNGDNWIQLSGMDTLNDYVDPFCFAFNSENQIFAGSYLHDGWGGVWRSVDSGYTWTNVPMGLPGSRQYDGVSAFGAVNILGISPAGAIFAATDSGFYRSTNNGDSWSEIDQSMPMSLLFYYAPSPQTLLPKYGLPKVKSVVFNSAGQVYVGYDRGVFYSKDNGDTWIPFIQDESKNYSVTALAFDQQGYLYGGNGGTIYRSSLTTSVSGLAENVPGTWKLEQNFPNPFNPSTTIRFTVPSSAGKQGSGIVSLKIYDLLGRNVATLVSEKLSAGRYSRQWNAAGLSSGVYFYRLHAGSFSETRKLLLLK